MLQSRAKNYKKSKNGNNFFIILGFWNFFQPQNWPTYGSRDHLVWNEIFSLLWIITGIIGGISNTQKVHEVYFVPVDQLLLELSTKIVKKGVLLSC